MLRACSVSNEYSKRIFEIINLTNRFDAQCTCTISYQEGEPVNRAFLHSRYNYVLGTLVQRVRRLFGSLLALTQLPMPRRCNVC